MKIIMISSLLTFFATATSFAQQESDSSFDVSVNQPYFSKKTPRALFDEGHQNYHTSSARYLPFCNLIRNDGCVVIPIKDKFSQAVLAGYQLLVIANAMNRFDSSAFTREECKVIREWVDAGGALLLITDHMPMSKMSQFMAEAFSVEFTYGTLLDSLNRDPEIKENSHLVYSKENGLLIKNAITDGVNKVVSFTGQGIRRVGNTIEILKASPGSYYERIELVDPKFTEQGFTTKIKTTGISSAAGFSQAIAFQSGEGRVIVTGEAAMLTAQVSGNQKFGMNYPGVDNKQLVLNMVRWLLE